VAQAVESALVVVVAVVATTIRVTPASLANHAGSSTPSTRESSDEIKAGLMIRGADC